MLYTIMDLTQVTEKAGEESFPGSLETIQFKGQDIQAFNLQNGYYQVERLLSTDPALYLQPDFMPGRLIAKE